jgi:di/tricarboxylate transporter
MDWQIALTLGVVALALVAMVREIAQPDLVMMAALLALTVSGILTADEAFAGFSNKAVVAIAVLFVVSQALRSTGALDLVLGFLLGRESSLTGILARVTAPVAVFSAFLNNAPIVAMMTPAVLDLSKRVQIAPSRLLLPLSYAAILGSSTTLIGTSVNLTVAGLISEAGMPEMGFFELFPLGAPIACVGLLYLIGVVWRVLPDREPPGDAIGERRREYVIAMRVADDCPLADQTVEDAGLRQLPGLFLVEIDREGRVLTPVAPDVPIRRGDVLLFAGVVSTIVDLQRIRGLVPIAEEEAGIQFSERRTLVEAVVSSSSPLVGSTVKEMSFRTVYDAAVIAVHRNGERVSGKIGEIVMRAGDTLLMQTAPGFMRAHRNSPDFYLVSDLGDGDKPRYDRAWIAIGTLVTMVLSVSLLGVPISIAALAAAAFLLLTRCVTGTEARQSVQVSILIVIAAGLGVAHAMEKTGAADWVASQVVVLAGIGSDASPWAALAVIYVMCLLMAETLQHNAAAAIMFPIAVATAHQVGADPRGFVMAVASASCCAFASPVAYQTHLIVYGPGGYRFTDFIRAGWPLDLLVATIAIALIPQIWPF